MSEARLNSFAIVFVTEHIEKTAAYSREMLGFRVVEHYEHVEKFAALYRDAVEIMLVQAKLWTGALQSRQLWRGI
jgi:catechol 2,3-dioxygenase-like lactoylglutathione lyase family enzyme